jgi:predicted AlkP superfamily pyrophosphatase or phosphodiesterase
MGIRFFLRTFPAPDREILAAATESIKQRNCRFYFLYLSEMDGILHEFCKEPHVIDEKLAWYNQQIRWVFETAYRSYEEVHLYVFSDHGMTPVIATFDLIREVGKLRLKIPGDYVAFYDSTMARFWFFKEEARQKITDLLTKLDVGHILSKDELTRWGVYFADGKFGHMVFLMNPGYVICPSYISNSAPNGMHGFTPEDKWSDAMFMSSIRLENQQRSILDFYSIMLQEAHHVAK